MLLSFTLSITAGLLLPQDEPSKENKDHTATVLSKGDLDSLRSRVKEYYKARAALRDAEGARRESARKKEEQARDKFKKEWQARTGKKEQEVLASVADLRAMFAGCFEFERQTGTGDMRNIKTKDWPTYDVVLPKKYRAETPIPTVILMRGAHGDKGWTSALDWYGGTWKAAAEAGEFVFVLPAVDDSIEFESVPDLAKPEGEALDVSRRETTLGSLGAASQTINVDRDRIYLDCGEGTCAWGLRLATYFPQLFAGIVLRRPPDPGDLRLDNLAGVPFLVLRTPETKEACDRLAEQLNKLKEGTATVLDAKGTYPHGDSAPEVAAWLKQQTRNLLRPQVVVANNHDTLKRAFWVFMGRAEALGEVAPEDRPRLEVVADRAANKLTVTCRGINDFAVQLNDALLDLDKEIVTIINGQAQPPFQLQRSLNELLDLVFNTRDPAMVFTARKGFEVPAEKTDKGKDAQAKDAEAKDDKGAKPK